LDATATLVLITVFAALIFDFINGFHDAANSIATVVSTRVLTPKVAVAWAAIFNFLAIFMGTKVAKTIGSGILDLNQITQFVIFAGLIGAITWNLLTWWWGLPTSSSHALMGGLAGAAITRSGFDVIVWAGWTKTLIFIVLAPFMGLVVGLGLMVAVSWIFQHRAPRTVDTWFRKLQLLSAAAYSLGHGGNDAQKTMGIIAGALYAGGFITQAELKGDWGHYHYPIVLSALGAISLGTYFGGWRIVRTMGAKITKLRPVGGFCAETAGALTLFLVTHFGIPVSTTHTITGAIIGVGSTQRLSAVRWGVAQRIVWAWVMTIPAAGTAAAICFVIIRWLFPSA